MSQMTLSNKTDSSSGNGNELVGARKGKTWPPLNFLAILNDANIQIDTSSPDKLCEQLYSGVYLKPNKLKYFVDKNSDKNCFVVYARELYICWSEDPNYWKWVKPTIGEEDIEVAELSKVCWLEVRGKIETIDLSPGVSYEIVFIVRMSSSLSGYGRHILNYSLRLTIIPPRVKRITRYESLKEKPVGNWFEILVGEFIMSRENVGTVEFCLEEYSPTWKFGLVLKCAVIRPKKE